jgi:Fuc2NAc and GlcNAc transferase
MMNIIFGCMILLVSWALAGAVRQYAIRNRLLDVPNHRSSHTVATPRGGGVAIVATFMTALAVMWFVGGVESSVALTYAIGGGAIAGVGFLDDHGHVPARWRLVCHFCICGVAVYLLPGSHIIEILDYRFNVGMLGGTVIILYMVWMLNLFNFMDGIDGIASVEAISVLAGFCLLQITNGSHAGVSIAAVLATATLGFMFWNFPKAKLFMGDVGSGFLGFAIGLLAIHQLFENPKLFWALAILSGVFVVDTTYTLAVRIFRKEKIYEAHRTHGYQYAARKYKSHIKVTGAVFAINLFWLLPISYCISRGWWEGVTGLAVAYLPLVLLAVWLKAGVPER